MNFHVASIQEIIDLAQEYFIPEAAGSISATVQLNFMDDDGEGWYLQVKNGSLTIEPGFDEAPDLNISMAKEDCFKVINGEINPLTAYMQRKIEITGEINKLIELKTAFYLPNEFEWMRNLV